MSVYTSRRRRSTQVKPKCAPGSNAPVSGSAFVDLAQPLEGAVDLLGRDALHVAAFEHRGRDDLDGDGHIRKKGGLPGPIGIKLVRLR